MRVAEEKVLSKAERIESVGQVAGWQGKVVAVAKEQLPAEWKLMIDTEQDWFVNTTCICQELGYKEVVSLDEALKRTIDWQRTHPPKEQEQSLQPWLLDYATEDAILTKLI